MNLRRALADRLDPDRTTRETAAIRRHLEARDLIRRAHQPLLVVSNSREALDVLGRRGLTQAVTVDQINNGQLTGLTLAGWIATDLALQHHRWQAAEDTLTAHLIHRKV